MMKRAVALILIMSGMIGAKGQALNNEIIPGNVKAAFNQRFGTATDWMWNMMGENAFSVVFKQNGSRHYAEVKNNGEITLLKYEIKEVELPIQILDALKAEYAQHKISEIDKIETGERIQYEVELDGYPDYILLFNPLGLVLEKKVD